MRGRVNGQSWQRTSQTLMAWNISGLGGTATSQGKDGNPQITGTLEALDHRGQVAGSKGLGKTHVDKEAVHRQVLVVCLQYSATGASLQVLPALETPAENPVDRGAEGERER